MPFSLKFPAANFPEDKKKPEQLFSPLYQQTEKRFRFCLLPEIRKTVTIQC